MTISIIFTTCSKTKNTIFWSDSVKKKKPAHYTQLTAENDQV